MAAITASDPDENSLTQTRRLMIMLSVVLGSTLYSTTLLIASTLLPQMQGAMGATQDEIAWVMTFNILATAVMTPMTGWRFEIAGRRDPAPRPSRLSRLTQPANIDLLRAVGVVARAAPRLVGIARNHHRDGRRRNRLLHLRDAQPDRRAAVSEPAPPP